MKNRQSSNAVLRKLLVRTLLGAAFAVAPAVVSGATDAQAGVTIDVCGDATEDGAIDSSDALFTLRVAVGLGDCPLYRCDPNGSATVTTIDALIVLKVAVGTDVALLCPELPSTTSTSTTIPEGCGNGLREPGEDCDPPGQFCRGGCDFLNDICVDISCEPDCSCPPAYCGDSVIDPQEDCDPVGSLCDGGICGADCFCQPSF